MRPHAYCPVKADGDWPAVREAFRQRMTVLRMGIQRLANVTGLSPTTIRYFGLRSATPSTVNQINNALGFPRGHLLAILRGESRRPVVAPDTLLQRVIRVEQKLDELLDLAQNDSRLSC